MKKKLTGILVYLAGAASVFALILGRISAARACGYCFYQPKVPDCMKQEEADVFLDHFGERIRGRMIIENLEYPYFSPEHWKEKRQRRWICSWLSSRLLRRRRTRS